MQNLAKSFSASFSADWPSWRSIRGDTAHVDLPLTIRLADQLRDEAINLELPAPPATIIAAARSESQRGKLPYSKVWDVLEVSLIRLVYDSNIIESAGTDFTVTMKICQDIFRGKEIDPKLEERDPAYQLHIDALRRADRDTSQTEVEKSRKEVINHAKALNFLIDQLVLQNKLLSEDLILQTHAILHDGLDDDVVAGQYRDHEVAVFYGKPNERAKKSICMRAKAVPVYMKDMVKNLENDLLSAEASGELDPYTLVARYHHQFVMIHPFGDGNGRMTRIIMNTLLLKYAGHVAPFGSGDERKDYLDIVTRGQKIFVKEDMEIEFARQTCHLEFAPFLLAKSKRGLLDMWKWARDQDK